MFDTHSVLLSTLVEEFQLEILFAATDFDKIRVTVEDVARPGLQLAGYYDHFEPMRLQVMGNAEVSYLQKHSDSERTVLFDRLFSYKFPALLVARNLDVGQQCLEMAKKHNITLLRSHEATSTIVSAIITYLKAALAPSITRHGVLMEVYGEGLLLLGDSGIGKSEAAVELLKRGHRLIADDAVEIRKISGNALVGTAPPLIRNYVELRGIGIVNVAKLFGMGAVKAENEINLVVSIVNLGEGLIRPLDHYLSRACTVALLGKHLDEFGIFNRSVDDYLLTLLYVCAFYGDKLSILSDNCFFHFTPQGNFVLTRL